MTDRDLREAVATKVMGLGPCAMRMCSFGSSMDGAWGSECESGLSLSPLLVDGEMYRHELCHQERIEGDTAHWQVVPPYELDIAAAWLIVETMLERGQMFILSQMTGLWCAHFGSKATDFTVAKTAPLAICRAALAAPEAER